MRSSRPRLLLLGALACAAPAAAGVDIDGDLLLGVWSQQRTRFIANVPACVYTDDRNDDRDDGADAYRITVFGSEASDRFVMGDGAGHSITYRILWYGSRERRARETLAPGIPSRRIYPFRTRSQCLAGDGSGLEARARTRDVGRAPPGIYRDTLTVVISPI